MRRLRHRNSRATRARRASDIRFSPSAAFWPIASFRTPALNDRSWSNNGHRAAQTRNSSVAFDPSRTSPHAEFPRDHGFRRIKRRLTKLLVGPRFLSCRAGRPTHWRLRRSSQKNTFGTRHQSERTSEGQFGLATQNNVARPFPFCCISNHRGHCFNFQHYPRLGLFSSVVADRICGWRLPRACFAPSGTSKA